MERYECRTSRVSEADIKNYARLRRDLFSDEDRQAVLDFLGVDSNISEREVKGYLARHLLQCHPCRGVYGQENKILDGYFDLKENTTNYLLATERVSGVFASRLVQEIRQEATILPFPKRKEI